MNKEQFFAAIKAEVKEVEVKALGAVLKFKVLTGKARDEFHAAVKDGDQSFSHFEAAIVAASLVDDEGNQMLTTADVDAMRNESAAAVAAVASVAMQVNKIGADAEAEAAKN
jgi:hypothetical protein